MRTEREIKAKLRYLEKRKRAAPNFWNILTLNAYQDLLQWWQGGKFQHLEVCNKRNRKSTPEIGAGRRAMKAVSNKVLRKAVSKKAGQG